MYEWIAEALSPNYLAVLAAVLLGCAVWFGLKRYFKSFAILSVVALIAAAPAQTGFPVALNNALMKKFPATGVFPVLRLAITTNGDSPPTWFRPNRDGNCASQGLQENIWNCVDGLNNSSWLAMANGIASQKNYIRNSNMQIDQLHNGGMSPVNAAMDTCQPKGGQQNPINDWLVPMQYNVGPTARGHITSGSKVVTSLAFTGVYSSFTALTALQGGNNTTFANWGPVYGSPVLTPPGTVIDTVDSATQITLSTVQTAGTGNYDMVFGGQCNTTFTSYPFPPTVQAEQITVTDLPGVNKALLMNLVTGSTNNSHQSFLGIAQQLYTDEVGWIGHGTPNAQTVTFGMWVKSTAAGKAGIGVQAASGIRQYNHMCDLTAAQWVLCSVTVPGDTRVTNTDCPGSTNWSPAQIWPQGGSPILTQYLIVVISFQLGSNFIGPADQWVCYYGGDSSQTQFTSVPGWSVQVSKAFLVPGNFIAPYNPPTMAESLQASQRMFETSYQFGQTIATNSLVGQSAIIGGVTVGNPAGRSVEFKTRKACTVWTDESLQVHPDLQVELYSPVTGAVTKARDEMTNVDVPVVLDQVSDTGFVWHATPAAGSGTIASLGVHWVAHCRPQ